MLTSLPVRRVFVRGLYTKDVTIPSVTSADCAVDLDAIMSNDHDIVARMRLDDAIGPRIYTWTRTKFEIHYKPAESSSRKRPVRIINLICFIYILNIRVAGDREIIIERGCNTKVGMNITQSRAAALHDRHRVMITEAKCIGDLSGIEHIQSGISSQEVEVIRRVPVDEITVLDSIFDIQLIFVRRQPFHTLLEIDTRCFRLVLRIRNSDKRKRCLCRRCCFFAAARISCLLCISTYFHYSYDYTKPVVRQ